jgi:amidophosphoribosyltransferase
MCGFVGIVGRDDVAPEIHLALQALQHRGQDSAGIAAMSADGDRFVARRGLGVVTRALGKDDLAALKGPIALGHVRYPTTGAGAIEDTQPFFYRVPGVLMAHNGNVTNYDQLRDRLLGRSIHLMSRCDVEPAMCEFADALMARRIADHTIDDAVAALDRVLMRVDGAYSLVAALKLEGRPTLVVMRDAHGFRPAVIGGRTDGGWVAASESVALDIFDIDHRFEPEPGEAIFLRHGEAPIRRRLRASKPAPCVFEFIYFARPDAVMNGRSVYQVRLALGRALADRVRQKGVEADVVVPVPDTARPAATALAEDLNLKLREGFIKNRYSGRTFIMPDTVTRESALRLKLNTIPSEISGRRVLLVDDSIVRGTTLRRVVDLVRRAGATAVHLAIHSPPVRNPCFYGIDMSTEEELFARRFEGDHDTLEISAASALGADTLTYLDVARMDAAFAGPRCAACFDGCYPREVSDECRANIISDRKNRETQGS